MWRTLAPAVLLSLVLIAGIGASVADAEEYCVEACIWGFTCPTGPVEHSPGRVELPLCVIPTPGGPEPTPTIVEEEQGEAISDTAAFVSARIDSRGKGVSSLDWQYSVGAEAVGGEQAPLEPQEVPGALEPAGEGAGFEVFRGSGRLTGLAPDTTYFYRAVVTNGSGALEYGPTALLHTEPAPPGAVAPEPGGAPAGGPPATVHTGIGAALVPAASSASSGSVASSGASAGADGSGLVSSTTRARKLASALRACRSKPTHARAACARRARKRFGKARGKA